MVAKDLKVAIVHDWLVSLGGGERVVESLTKLFPQAVVYTSVYKPENMPILKQNEVKTTFLQHWPLAKKKHQLYSPLRPVAFEMLELSDYDLVISSSSAESKGVITRSETLHIAYIHTPTRYYWSGYEDYLAHPGFGALNPLARAVLPRMVKKLRRWDYAAAQRPNYLVANSAEVAGRIKKYYDRESTVIHPPVEVERFLDKPSKEGDYYLVVSRLIPYKKTDLAIEACNKLGKKLIVVGRGTDYKNLQKLAGPTVEFVQNADDKQVEKLFLNCKAFLFPAFEDFGITPVEAMAAGKPVICYGQGGATESVVNGKTGVFFPKQNGDSLAQAIEDFEKLKFDSKSIREHAKKFSETRFLEEIGGYIEQKGQNYQAFS